MKSLHFIGLLLCLLLAGCATPRDAADSSNPTFIEAGKAYLITLPTASDGNPNKIIEIISAAGGGWYRVISYPVRRGTDMQEKSALPTEMWINFAQVVTAEVITHDNTPSGKTREQRQKANNELIYPTNPPRQFLPIPGAETSK